MTIFTFSSIRPECFLVFQNWYPYFFLLQINVISRLVSGKALFFSEKKCQGHNKPQTLPLYQQMTKKS